MFYPECHRNRVPLRLVGWWGIMAIVLSGGATPVTARAVDESPLSLVGVGPGDPDLMTLRAVATVDQADVIFCSDWIVERFGEALRLGEKEVYNQYWRLFPFYGQDLASVPAEQRPDAEALDAKRKEFIAKVREAVKQGKKIAILDSGDPLIYGPWAWTLEEFADLKLVVVPGLSSFNAANAALGRGVTNAETTKAVILSSDDWPGKTDTIERLATHGSTMVLFTMRAEFADLIRKLRTQYPPETPVAIVKYAGFASQEEVVPGRLETILDQVSSDDLPFEYLIYVGSFLDHRYRRASDVSP